MRRGICCASSSRDLVGDYGFDHGGPGTHTVDFWAKNAGIQRVLVTLGNHEDWGRIVTAQGAAEGVALRVSEAVWLLPRPFRFRLAGREVLSPGGASSVDKSYRTDGKDWFEEELITEAMEAAAVAGGRAVPEAQAILAGNPARVAS